MAFANDNYNRNRNVNGYTDTGTGYKPNVVKTPTTTYVQPHGSDNYYVGQNKDGYVYYSGNTNTDNNNNTRSNNSNQVSAPGSNNSYNPVKDFESIWEKYYNAAKAAAEAQRDKDLAELENDWERARNKRNVQYLNDAKSMSRLYGTRDSQYGGNYGGDTKRGGQGSFGSMYGGGWTNQLANKLGWRSDNADLLANRNTNVNNVRTNYSNYLANLELQKLNNWSNVMAPYYMNQSFLG